MLSMVPVERDPGATPGPAELAICTRGLSKHYRHPWTLRVTRGLDALDLDVRRGEVFGALGPNGAGKTTTIKLLAGLLRPTSGSAWLFGAPIGSLASRRRLGYLPEQPYFYDSLTGLEYLGFVGRLSGLAGRDADERAKRWLGRVGLGERPRLVLRKYSKGMLQRIGLAAALIHEPELLILDEPMSGLDPFGRRDVRELIIEQRDRGVSVMLSSHILPDVEMLCDRVGVVLEGVLVRTATVNELVASHQQRVEIRCVGAPLLEVPAPWQGTLARVELPEGTTFVLDDERQLDGVLAWLLESGARVRAVTPQRASLEDFFLTVAESRPGVEPRRRSA